MEYDIKKIEEWLNENIEVLQVFIFDAKTTIKQIFSCRKEALIVEISTIEAKDTKDYLDLDHEFYRCKICGGHEEHHYYTDILNHMLENHINLKDFQKSP